MVWEGGLKLAGIHFSWRYLFSVFSGVCGCMCVLAQLLTIAELSLCTFKRPVIFAACRTLRAVMMLVTPVSLTRTTLRVVVVVVVVVHSSQLLRTLEWGIQLAVSPQPRFRCSQVARLLSNQKSSFQPHLRKLHEVTS